MRAIIIITILLFFFVQNSISQNKEPYFSQNFYIYKECVNKLLNEGYCKNAMFFKEGFSKYKQPENIILVLKEPLLTNIEINDTINGFHLIDIAEKDLYAYLKQNPSKNFFVLSIFDVVFNNFDILQLSVSIKLTIYNDKTNPLEYNDYFCDNRIYFKYLKDNHLWRAY